jgi:4-hydroxythreonine-4-phosphate dehydrogenase
VVLKAIKQIRHENTNFDPLLVGCRHWLEQSYTQLSAHSKTCLASPFELDVLHIPLDYSVVPGSANSKTGAASFNWLTAATAAVLQGKCNTLCTAPISKHAWHAAGHRYPGQTERLAELCGGSDAAMLFTARSPHNGWRFNTLLATTHIPLGKVSETLNTKLLNKRLNQLHNFCLRFNESPKLAVAGLNPHAGEEGELGSEEQEWIKPLLDKLRNQTKRGGLGFKLDGPLPPDSCWLGASKAWHNPNTTRSIPEAIDGYLALYHDQGLIPTKLLAFDQAVNTTLGLPFLRTSPDHGTAFNIAGRGIARAESMVAAINTALELG